MTLLKAQDLAQLDAAVKRAESRTEAEIAVVVHGASDEYVGVRGPLALVVASVFTAAALVWLPGLAGLDAVAIQTLLVVLVFTLSSPAVRFLVPAHVQSAAVETAAHAAFSRLGVHATRGRCGVLLYVSEREHRVHLLADRGASEALGQPAMDAHVAHMVRSMKDGDPVAGLVEAAETLGAQLATHFPARRDPVNELPDVSVSR